jgi:Cysteine-rich secretory protein family
MRLHPTRRGIAELCAAGAIAATLALAFSAAPAGAATITWQARLNAVRSMSLLPAVSSNAAWGSGCYNHSRYMTMNRMITHSESTSNRWYSTSGAYAAPRSNLAMASPYGALGTGSRAIDLWAVGPFHALGMLNPKLKSVGWGMYRASGRSDSAALNIRSGVVSTAAATYPVKWPGPGSTTPYLRFSGGETPNPIQGMGYATPTGPPIIIQFASAPSITAYSLRLDTTALSCKLVTPTTYRNTNASQQALGRQILAQSRAVYIVPRSPLASGKTYTVSVVNAGVRYTWSFKAGAAPAPATSH